VTLEASADGNRDVASVDVTIEEAPDNRQLVFIDNGDGTVFKMKSLALADGSVSDLFDLPGFSMGVAYDADNGFIYYTDDDNLTVLRNTLAGDAETVIASDLGGPRDLALDAANNILYVADRGSDAIVAIDLADNSTSVIFDTSDDETFLFPVGIDFYDGTLYMTAVDIDAETVWTGNPDGTGLTRIIDFSAGGFGYGITVDPVNEKIYFDDNDGGSIRRANLDGSSIETVGSASDRSYGIAVDNSQDRVFWATRDGQIVDAALDGSASQVILNTEGDNDFRGMVLINPEN
ncbi:MAG TPA: hypothetical protein DCP28_37295, partial [Cytophagales bacterium]|nr:hypothetical protein [Cytophagales bacterium]